jgi:hypothetical protein
MSELLGDDRSLDEALLLGVTVEVTATSAAVIECVSDGAVAPSAS